MILLLYQSSVFDDIALMVKESLAVQNIPCYIVSRPLPVSSQDLYIVLGAHDLDFELLGSGHKYVIYQFEQVNCEGTAKNWFEGDDGAKYLATLRSALAVYDYSEYNCRLLHEKFALKAEFLPLRWSRFRETQSTRRVRPTYDVSFLGSVNERRAIIIKELKNAGLTVEYRSNLWRNQKASFVRQSKVSLNIHYYPLATLETTRLLELLALKTLIISEPSTDPILDQQFSPYVVFCPREQLVSTVQYWVKNDQEREQFVKQAYEKIATSTLFEFPTTTITTSEAQIEMIPNFVESLPEPDLLQLKEAPVEITPEGYGVLKMAPQPTLEEMPPVTVLTVTRNRPELFRLAINNWQQFVYPEDKLHWVIIDDSLEPMVKSLLPSGDERISYYHLPRDEEHKMTISEKRNLAVQHAPTDIVVHMDDDDYYYPNSIYARVKVLVDNLKSGIECVGCSGYGVYHLLDNYCFELGSSSKNRGAGYLSEASLCYYRNFWAKQPFAEHLNGESVPFLRNRRSRVMNIPYKFVFIAITHGYNVTNELRSLPAGVTRRNDLYKELDFETQRLLNSIWRQLRARVSVP